MKRLFMVIVILATGIHAWGQAEEIAPKARGNYYGRGSVGLLIGDLSSGSAQISNGYSFACGLDVGLGLGYENYNYSRYAPLFVETRYHFGKRETKPFVGLMTGYMAGLNQYDRARGLTAGFQAGITHYFTKHFGITTSLGYRYILTRSNNIYYTQLHMYIMPPQVEDANIHRIEVRFGIVIR